MTKVAIIAFDDFTDLDLILHWDLLSRVRTIAGVQSWSVQILGTQPSHLSTLGLPIPMSGSIDQASEADGVILCSGRGTRPLLGDKEFLTRLRLDPKRQWIGAQCSGSLILGALGILGGKKVSAYPPILSHLKSYGVELVHESLVVDGKIATASSCLAGQFLSEWMIRSLAGADVAQKVMNTVMPLSLCERV